MSESNPRSFEGPMINTLNWQLNHIRETEGDVAYAKMLALKLGQIIPMLPAGINDEIDRMSLLNQMTFAPHLARVAKSPELSKIYREDFEHWSGKARQIKRIAEGPYAKFYEQEMMWG